MVETSAGEVETSREVLPGVHRIVMPLGDRINSVYAFVGERRILLFDTALDGDISGSVAPYLISIGRDITDVSLAVISHGDVDHFGGNAELHELAPGALIACHRGDLELVSDPEFVFETRYDELSGEGLPDSPEFGRWCVEHARSSPVDLVLAGGEDVVLEDGWAVRVLHVPGHSTGHLAISDLRSGGVVVSDAVLGDSVNLADGSPAFPPTYRFAADYVGTIDLLTSLSPSAVFTAHYPAMDAGAGREFLELSRAFADRCDQVVLEHVSEAAAPISVREVVLGVAGRLGPWPVDTVAAALGQPVVGHLEWLTDRGLLHVETRQDIRRWSVPG